MAIRYKIYENGPYMLIHKYDTILNDYYNVIEIEKRRFACTNNGTQVLIYNSFTTFPTTRNAFLAIEVADIINPVIATSARMAAILNIIATTEPFGYYTPTLTNVANLSASTAYEFQYSRIGNIVTFSGKVDADPIAAAGTATQLGISFPFASTIAAQEDCAGTACGPAIVSLSAAIIGDIVNARAEMAWAAPDLTNQSLYLQAQYVLL